MRISTEKLPDNSAILRLHSDESEYYTSITVVKPLSDIDCELVGFVGVPDKSRIKMLFNECRRLGYGFVHIERRKNGIKSRKVFKL